jgi:uncharacterized repeat protein (TIGR01451 family)
MRPNAGVSETERVMDQMASENRYWKGMSYCRCLLGLLGCFGLLLGCGQPAVATYIMRYSTITNGGMTYTGNTLGRTRNNGVGAIEYFLTPTGGNTTTWANNGSRANLQIPSGSTILYAELIWGGSYRFGNQDVTSSLNNAIKFTTPAGGTYNISPDPSTSATLTNPKYFYVRSANVTSYVRAAGVGTYTVAAVPATVDSNDNDDHAGWTLAVIYSNYELPGRSLTIFVGAEYVDGSNVATSAVSGFRTKRVGTNYARLMVSAQEGECGISGDQMYFGPTTSSLTAVSGPRNPVNNFFASQINGDDGNTDTSGTYGNNNQPISGTDQANRRQGWDITNIDVSRTITAGQTAAVARGTSSQDAYVINSAGLQIDIDAPVFLTTALSVDKTSTYLGDTLTYTIRLSNAAGANDALNVFFKDPMPEGTSFIPGSVTVDGVAWPDANPERGMAFGTIRGGQTMTVQLKCRADAIPMEPAAAEYLNTASWTYQYRCLEGSPLINGKLVTNTVATGIIRLVLEKTVTPTTANPNSTLTYTITVRNAGATTSGTTLTDPIPAGTTYVTRSTYLNGTRQNDINNNQMPYAAGRTINSSGEPAGVINAGETATIRFQVRIGTNPPLPIVNVATVDPDGSGPAPPQQVAISNPVSTVNLGVTITDELTAVNAGQTVTYTIRVTNSSGSSQVGGLKLFFDPPEGFEIDSITPSSGSYNSSTYDWTGLALAGGGNVTLTVTGTIDPDASGNQVATVTIEPPLGIADSNPNNDTASDTDTLNFQADLGVEVSDGRTKVTPGENLDYLVTVTNYGPSPVNSVRINGVIPAQFTVTSYQSDQGVYNLDTKDLVGLNLRRGEAVNLTVRGAVNPSAGLGAMTYTVSVSEPTGIADPNPANNSASDIDTVLWYTLVGLVYQDVNHNGAWDYGEAGTGIGGIYAKLVRGSESSAIQAVAVNPTSGVFQFANLGMGVYKVLIDSNNTLSDITPTLTATGWLVTETPTLIRTDIPIETVSTGINFGLWRGSQLSGIVFNDNGSGGGMANDGAQNGGEAGTDGILVRALTQSGAIIAETVTAGGGKYGFWLPYAHQNTTISVTEINPTGWVSTGGKPGTTGGSYARATDTVSFTLVSGNLYTGVIFGDVPGNVFTNDGRQLAAPGSVAVYPHTYGAASKGQVSFTIEQATNPAGLNWPYSIYRDLNGNQRLDPTDSLIAGPIQLTTNETLMILIKDFVPSYAPYNSRNQLKIISRFTYDNANPDLTASLTRIDLTTVDDTTPASLTLLKNVDRANAQPGEVITYTITYVNNSNEELRSIIINDMTPAFTTFYNSSFGSLPANLTACTITQPAIGGTGAVAWAFTGILAPGGQGTVSYQVKLQ